MSNPKFMVTEAIEKVQIVVDDRERPSGVVAELEKLDGLVLKIEHLTVGDYCIDGAVLIERKTAAHFAQSFNRWPPVWSSPSGWHFQSATSQ